MLSIFRDRLILTYEAILGTGASVLSWCSSILLRARFPGGIKGGNTNLYRPYRIDARLPIVKQSIPFGTRPIHEGHWVCNIRGLGKKGPTLMKQPRGPPSTSSDRQVPCRIRRAGIPRSWACFQRGTAARSRCRDPLRRIVHVAAGGAFPFRHGRLSPRPVLRGTQGSSSTNEELRRDIPPLPLTVRER